MVLVVDFVFSLFGALTAFSFKGVAVYCVLRPCITRMHVHNGVLRHYQFTFPNYNNIECEKLIASCVTARDIDYLFQTKFRWWVGK